ncbi:MAG: lysostaphin resistance A-like protein [Wujia sp.]
MESSKNTLNFKLILGLFLPLIIAVLIQYIVAWTDMLILFVGHMNSTQALGPGETIGSVMTESYNQPMNLAYMTLAQHLLYLLVFGIWYRNLYKKHTEDKRSIPKRIFLLCAFMGYVAQCMVDGILTYARPIFPKAFAQYDELLSKVSGANQSTVMLIAVIVIAPIGEELLFRGLILDKAKQLLPIPMAIVLQAALFGIYHGIAVQVVYAFLLGLVLGILAHRTGNLLVAVAFHFAVNASLLLVPSSWFSTSLGCAITTIFATLLFIGLFLFIYKTSVTKKEI